MVRPDPIDRQHLRYTEQAAWTAGLRRRLLGRIPDQPAALLLEVGAGTGAIAADIARPASGGAGVGARHRSGGMPIWVASRCRRDLALRRRPWAALPVVLARRDPLPLRAALAG